MYERTTILSDCLIACQEIEIITSQIYHFHADHFADMEQIANTWRQTAVEEVYHARQVALARSLVNSISCHEFDVSLTESTRNLCRALFEAIKKSPPTLEEAILTSIELEETLAQLHMENAMIFEKKGGIYLFRGLMMQDIKHIEELENALRKLPSRGLRAA
jgi:rubrerythrin